MNSYFTRIASLVLAFGFFISCSVLQSSQSEPQSPRNLSEQQIRQKIDSLNSKITSGSTSASLYYQKATLHTKLAQKRSNPNERTSMYVSAHEAFTKAVDLYQDSAAPRTEKIREKRKVMWSNEHNQGVQILQRDTSDTTPDYTRAAAHFNNATVIIPDSAISYEMGARAHYKNQQLEKAIRVLEEANQKINDLSPLLLEQLAFLYMENNQPQEAIGIYEKAESFSSQNMNLLHGLANAYINSGNHQQAVQILERLIENEPENVIYGHSLATELYLMAGEKIQQIIPDLRSGNNIQSTAFNTSDSLLQRAEERFKQTISANPNDRDLELSFARFYQNSASKYQQLLPFVKKENKQQLENTIKEYVSSSIPLFEQLAKQIPDEQQIWHNLYQAYSYLGMDEKAQNAKSNY
jgi:tetratricopeptide (TPR) repeat protein